MSELTVKSPATARWKRATRGGCILAISLATVLRGVAQNTAAPESNVGIIGGTVRYREITLSPTHRSRGIEENPPLPVYDFSAPFSDPNCSVDIAGGLPKPCRNWIVERKDTELLHGLSSEHGRQRANDLLTFELRFPSRTRPPRALCGRNVTQMHYARIVYSRENTVAVMNILAPQRGSSKTVIGNSVFSLRSHGEHP